MPDRAWSGIRLRVGKYRDLPRGAFLVSACLHGLLLASWIDQGPTGRLASGRTTQPVELVFEKHDVPEVGADAHPVTKMDPQAGVATEAAPPRAAVPEVATAVPIVPSPNRPVASPRRVVRPRHEAGIRGGPVPPAVVRQDERPDSQSVSASIGSASAVPPKAARPAPQAGRDAIDPAWRRDVSAWLESHKIYPESARRHGDQGTALVQSTIDRSGRVVDVVVLNGTGSPRLDAAISVLFRNAQCPSFPNSMTGERATIEVRLHYVLAD